MFDANLGPPLNDTLPFPKAMLDMVRDSGVTAVKTSLGGSDEKFEDTVGEIAFFQRMIEAYPELFLQVREASDFARAKREKKFGILFSFESTDMFEGKVERIELFRDLGVRVMQLSYNKTSPWASGVMADPPQRSDRSRPQSGRGDERAGRRHRHLARQRGDVEGRARGVQARGAHHPCRLRGDPSPSA